MVDPQKLKSLAEKLSPEDRDALDHLLVVAGSAADSDGDGKPDVQGLQALFHKNGEFSKTSVILVLAWACGLSLWVVQALFVGVAVFGHTIPPFDSSAALSMLGAASSLYFAAHNIKANVGAGAAAPNTRIEP
jgi:hypothetical protein